MNGRAFVVVAGITLATWMIGCTKKEEVKGDRTKITHEDPDGYYTCPMHPQVHEHKPGPCPICGMALVKVKGKEEKKDTVVQDELQPTNQQLNLAGIGKYTVTKKDLVVSISASGRMLSSREVVFQVYESDVQAIKAGMKFKGEASASPGENLTGQIRSIDTLTDPSTRTIRVTGILDKGAKRTISESGFFGEIYDTLKSQLVVPENAVLHTGNENRVYLISAENKIKPQPVILGAKSKNEYLVLEGLNEGDVISSGPNFLIDSEAKLKGGGDDQAHH